jgi:hypothetical protein
VPEYVDGAFDADSVEIDLMLEGRFLHQRADQVLLDGVHHESLCFLGFQLCQASRRLFHRPSSRVGHAITAGMGCAILDGLSSGFRMVFGLKARRILV